MEETIIVFLGGAAHIPTIKLKSKRIASNIHGLKERIDENNDTISWYVRDSVANEFLEPNPSKVVLGFFGEVDFDVVSFKIPENERERTANEKLECIINLNPLACDNSLDIHNLFTPPEHLHFFESAARSSPKFFSSKEYKPNIMEQSSLSTPSCSSSYNCNNSAT
ncbi:MAG: hypothetical protein WBE18_01185 [Gammaproteobacteria bacterium]